LPYCSKCGSKVAEDIAYCPKCRASLKAEPVTRQVREKGEKREKDEKQEKEEKGEKGEKHEKGETSRFWVLVGGLMLVILGLVSFVTILFEVSEPLRGASFLVVLGTFIIIIAIYGAVKASQRNPQP
jgi:predicted ATP-dependent serine protease